MEQQQARSFTSSLYQMMDLPMQSGSLIDSSHHPESPETFHESIDDYMRGLSHRRPVAQAPRVLENTFDSWLLETAPCGSPQSTCSSLSPSESVSTPQYMAQLPLPMYQLHEEPLLPCMNMPIGYPVYEAMNQNDWSSHYPEGDSCHTYPPMPNWNSDIYLARCVPHLPSSIAVPYSHGADVRHSNERFTDSASFRAEEKSSGEDSTDTGESDSDDSEYEDSECAEENTADSMSRNRIPSGVLKLGKWDLNSDPYNRPESRNYPCLLSSSVCSKRFVRPEHLRRHMKTVHGAEKDYCCKVPECKRAFSRGDNLRDHYWTHLHRGGRVGRNSKMSLPELKLILGPREKKLVRKLKARLGKIKARHSRAAA